MNISCALKFDEDAQRALAAQAAEIALAQLRAERVGQANSPYLTVAETAEYMRCSRQRVYDLLSAGRLTRFKDGSRVLVRRTEVDAYLLGGAG